MTSIFKMTVLLAILLQSSACGIIWEDVSRLNIHQYIYGFDFSPGNIHVFNVNMQTGSLSENSSLLMSSGFAHPTWISADPSAKYLYVTDGVSSGIKSFAIDPQTGALTYLQTITASEPTQIFFHPNGKWVYVGNGGAGSVYGFTFDPSTGNLTAMPGPPFPIAGLVATVSVLVDPTQKYLLALDWGSVKVGSCTINSDGSLAYTGKPLWPVAGQSAPQWIVMSNTDFGFVAPDNSTGPPGFTLSSDGSISTTTGSPFSNGGDGSLEIFFDVNDRFAFMGNQLGSNTLNVYTYNSSNGSISQAPGSPYSPDTLVTGIVEDPLGRFLDADGRSQIFSYSLASNGQLTATTPAFADLSSGHFNGYLALVQTEFYK